MRGHRSPSSRDLETGVWNSKRVEARRAKALYVPQFYTKQVSYVSNWVTRNSQPRSLTAHTQVKTGVRRVSCRMLLALVSLSVTTRCELMVVSPGTATAASLDALCASCRAFAALRSATGGRVTLLLREPGLEHEQIESFVRDLAPLFAPDYLVLHEKCAGARLVASEHGLGVHVKSTLECTDRGATHTG